LVHHGQYLFYLSAMRLPDVVRASGVTFRWRSFSLRTILQEMRCIPFADKPAKFAYIWRDIERRAAICGLSVGVPAPYLLKETYSPTGSRSEGGMGQEFVRAAYRRWFLLGEESGSEPNVSESLREVPPPPFATTKVTDNVYIFRYGNHQPMFVIAPDGVIATDPISLRRPAKPYIDAIQAVTKAPIKYVIYSHSHFDHTAGGRPFKDLGATFVAQRNAERRIAELNPPDVVVPDQVVDDRRVIRLGGTTLELNYVGKNHSNSTLVMRLPTERIIFTVDWIPIEGVQFRDMADTYVPDIEAGLKRVIAMDWETLIPGHPGPGGKQTGTKDNARDQLAYLQDLSAAVKKEVDAGKTYDEAMKDISLPKYESWPNYKAFLPMNIERYYDSWNRGI
jgi:glyoxylase-like metal-dependent hydrolase (beta-lactamase superfamily II)